MKDAAHPSSSLSAKAPTLANLEGKVAVITGAAKGQGEAEARLFVALGARVVLGDILVDEVNQLGKDLGDNCRSTRLDVTREEDWEAVVGLAVSEFGRLDILVNNAGIFEYARLDNASVDHYRRVLAVNQEGPFLGMRAAISALTEAGGGSIVNTSSVSAELPFEGQIAYAASKAAVVAMTKVAAMELGPQGIRVNVVLPGGVNTDMHRATEDQIKFYGRLAAGRIGEPIEIARVVAFLASDDASYVTGSAFVVDGGWGAGRYEAEFFL